MWDELKEEFRNKARPRSRQIGDDDILELDSEANPVNMVRADSTGYTVDDPDTFQKELVADGIYDPLKDMRPYYYATYDKVRGTGQAYVKPNPEPTHWSDFVIDSSKGDEFQMNSRNDDTLETLSFMDILNRNVVYKTKPREVNIDPIDGGEVITFQKSEPDPTNDSESNPTKDKEPEWCSGKTAGINFDLPTEAQWEYCCRLGTTPAVPPSYDLGDTFETNHAGLDLIAWYKYKVIGSEPEPERFCAWRISKMLFGIGKDNELVNNVYEETTF